jgi:hypothetical protein
MVRFALCLAQNVREEAPLIWHDVKIVVLRTLDAVAVL